MAKQMFEKISLASEILKFLPTIEECETLMSSCTKGSRALWNNNKDKWLV